MGIVALISLAYVVINHLLNEVQILLHFSASQLIILKGVNMGLRDLSLLLEIVSTAGH